MTTPWPLFALTLALMAWASVSDLRTRRIPNLCSVGGMAVAAAAALACGAPTTTHLLTMAAVLATLGGAAAMRPGSLGAGDVKLAGVVALGLGALAPLALLVAFALSVGWSVAGSPAHPLRAIRGESVPLAPFMAAGTALAPAMVG